MQYKLPVGVMNTVTNTESSYYTANVNEKTEKGPCVASLGCKGLTLINHYRTGRISNRNWLIVSSELEDIVTLLQCDNHEIIEAHYSFSGFFKMGTTTSF